MTVKEERLENIKILKSELQQILRTREYLNLAEIEVTLNVDLEYDFDMLNSRFDFRRNQICHNDFYNSDVMQASVTNRINKLNKGLIPLRDYLLNGDVEKNADYLDFIDDCNRFLRILEIKANNNEL